MQLPLCDAIPVVVGDRIIVALLYSAQVQAQLGFINIEFTDEALATEDEEAHNRQRVARCCLCKAQNVKLPLLGRILITQGCIIRGCKMILKPCMKTLQRPCAVCWTVVMHYHGALASAQ